MRDRPYTLLSRAALLSNNPDKARQLRSCGVTVVEQVPTGVYVCASNLRYLETKARRGRHTLELSSVLRSRSSDTTWWNRARLLFRSKSSDQQKGCRCQSDPRAA
jgi:hypothetical protein